MAHSSHSCSPSSPSLSSPCHFSIFPNFYHLLSESWCWFCIFRERVRLDRGGDRRAVAAVWAFLVLEWVRLAHLCRLLHNPMNNAAHMLFKHLVGNHCLATKNTMYRHGHSSHAGHKTDEVWYTPPANNLNSSACETVHHFKNKTCITSWGRLSYYIITTVLGWDFGPELCLAQRKACYCLSSKSVQHAATWWFQVRLHRCDVLQNLCNYLCTEIALLSACWWLLCFTHV